MQELLSTRLDEAVVPIAARWRAPRRVGDEGAALLHAREHADHARGTFHASVVRLDQVFFAHAFRRSQDGDPLVVGDSPHPGFVGVGALLEDGWLDAGDADDIVEEVNEVLWALQSLDVAVQHDAIPTRIHPLDSRAQKLQQSIHGMILLRWDV